MTHTNYAVSSWAYHTQCMGIFNRNWPPSPVTERIHHMLVGQKRQRQENYKQSQTYHSIQL